MIKFTYDAYTAVGGRQNNEDSYAKAEKNGCYLFVVADGLGGHDCGEIASGIATEGVKKIFLKDPLKFDTIQAIESVNKKIIQEQENSSKKMMTTIVLVYIANEQVVFCHVGDSRAYAFASDQIIYQSVDHSASQMAVSVGEITTEQIRNHEDRNVLTRALGVSEKLKVEKVTIQQNEIDAILLCTDGFWEYVYEKDMVEMLITSKNPDVWLFKMREIVCSNAPSGNDNNTAIAIMKGE